MKIARLYARKTPYDKEDLIQEAFARVLSGRRAWTKGTGPVLFLGGVIRSIAWEWKSEGPLHATPLTDFQMEERNANAAIGIVERLNQPGGNVTGFALFEPTLAGKWLELLSEIAGAQAGRNHVQPRHGSRIDFYALI